MKIQLICGFLGAGKTTMLKNILQHETSDTAVLVNEFGELGIDGTLISEGNNFNVVELPSGCICCSLRQNMVESIKEIMDKWNPSQLIIEPSGIAAPSSIIEGIKQSDFCDQINLAPVIGVIDVTFFINLVEEDDYNNFFLDQMANSDIILLNKADLVSKEVMEQCHQAVIDHNPLAVVIPSSFCQVDLPEVEARGEAKHYHFTNQFQVESFSTKDKVSQEQIEQLMIGLSEGRFGSIYRAKGIFSTGQGYFTFDYVNGSHSYGCLESADENKFVFIGIEIDRSEIEKAIMGGARDGSGA